MTLISMAYQKGKGGPTVAYSKVSAVGMGCSLVTGGAWLMADCL